MPTEPPAVAEALRATEAFDADDALRDTFVPADTSFDTMALLGVFFSAP